MTEDVSLAKIEAIRETIQKNLAIVQQALGIDTESKYDLDESAFEPEISAEETVSNFPKKKLSASELLVERNELNAMREANKARFAESQAMFAESVARFNMTKEKFKNRRKQGNHAFMRGSPASF